jgi:hypothetical protein
MTSQLDLFRAIREVLDDIRERTNAIEYDVVRAQIYSEHSAAINAATNVRTLQSAASGLRTLLEQCRCESVAVPLPATQEQRRRRCRPTRRDDTALPS